MKQINKIFLSLLALAAITACENEVLIGPEKGSQVENLSAVLMISAGTNDNVETKSGTETATTYVYVYDSAGNFITSSNSGVSSSVKGQMAFNAINAVGAVSASGWSNADEIEAVIHAQNVVIGDAKMHAGDRVKVVIIANPTENVKIEAIKSFNALKSGLTTLKEQVDLYKEGKETAVQYLEIELAKGINYLGPENNGIPANNSENKDWWHYVTTAKIPLYRLISEVNLVRIRPGGALSNFLLRKAYLLATSNDDKSAIVPSNSVSTEGMNITISPNSENDYQKWCERISKYPGDQGSMEYLFGGVMNGKLGIAITESTSAEKGKLCTVYKKPGLIWGQLEYKLEDLIKPLYAFEQENENITYFVIEGNYGEGAVPFADETYYRYYIPIEINEEGVSYGFRRNHVYNIDVTISGPGNKPEDPIPSGGSAEVSATIEIAQMAEQDLDFTFGD